MDSPLFTARLGTGTPMLCMHGGMGFDHSTLRPYLSPLASKCELIFYDHRGNGRSENPEWSNWNHSDWIADAEQLRLRFGFEKMLVFGHSWGGFLAQEYALAYPQRVAGLILCCTAPALDHGPVIVENARRRGTPQQVEALLAALAEPLHDDDALAALMNTIGSLYFHRNAEEHARALFPGIRYSARAFNRALFHCAPAFNTTERLNELRMPTLLLAGLDDWIMPETHGVNRLASGIPHATVHRFGHCGHFPFVEKHEECMRVIAEWLASIAPSVSTSN